VNALSAWPKLPACFPEGEERCSVLQIASRYRMEPRAGEVSVGLDCHVAPEASVQQTPYSEARGLSPSRRLKLLAYKPGKCVIQQTKGRNPSRPQVCPAKHGGLVGWWEWPHTKAMRRRHSLFPAATVADDWTERAAMLVVDGTKTPEATTPMPRWRVDILRKHTEHFGIVTAPNAQEALHRAVSLFRIKPDQHSKLMIRKIEDQPQDHFVD